MEYGAIDLHKKESQIRIVTATGDVIDRRIATTREGFRALFETAIVVSGHTSSERAAAP